MLIAASNPMLCPIHVFRAAMRSAARKAYPNWSEFLVAPLEKCGRSLATWALALFPPLTTPTPSVQDCNPCAV